VTRGGWKMSSNRSSGTDGEWVELRVPALSGFTGKIVDISRGGCITSLTQRRDKNGEDGREFT
jgi:hypothetical protein